MQKSSPEILDMIALLTRRCDELEKKVKNSKQWSKEMIDDFFQHRIPPPISWEEWTREELIVLPQHITFLHQHSFIETMQKVWMDCFLENKDKSLPVVSLFKKIYICREIPYWEELTNDILKRVLGQMQQKMMQELENWQQKYPKEETMYQKALIKCMSSLDNPQIFVKIKYTFHTCCRHE
jgi:hypothetical protein